MEIEGEIERASQGINNIALDNINVPFNPLLEFYEVDVSDISLAEIEPKVGTTGKTTSELQLAKDHSGPNVNLYI